MGRCKEGVILYQAMRWGGVKRVLFNTRPCDGAV